MAFSADELRVLRRALANALHPAPLPEGDVHDVLRLTESVDEAVREATRLRAFLLDDLARYREALPGSLPGYLDLLEGALLGGYDPGADDLAALRALRGNPAAARLLARCQVLAERSVRARLARVSQATASAAPAPASRARLLALPGGRAAEEPRPKPPGPVPAERPVPKPSEVFPPRRRPVPPPPPEERAAG
ncbi:hypothetical protein [Streptomyces omiyaensis]|uniref:Uncharacterized protein n=1 Tax=Streptomyces omiyaensis TaxID=68247 RepID=A0ABW7BUS8_9ACTN|nr:hypothetical protein [Streptomyces omiyaensis]GGY44417.1 hypothetical protein GCM10010363_26690 [Streptomyces omiyaensis]